MRVLMMHANRFLSEIVEASTRPASIVKETNERPKRDLVNCIVVLFTLENGDSEATINNLYTDIVKFTVETKMKYIMICPFAHLSNNLAEPFKAKKLYENLVSLFDGSEFIVETSHFGYHKSLLLDLKGYPGAFRYREFI